MWSDLEFKNKKVLVVGLGDSGFAAVNRLKKMGAEVEVVDSGQSSALRKRAQILKLRDISVKLGKHLLSDLEGQELIVVSPGVPNYLDLLEEARRKRIPIWSEIEMAFRLTENKIIGITGTNGKTTTTLLLGKIFQDAGLNAVVAGNVGLPLVKAVEKTKKDELLIVELSSFQLKNIVRFRPWISVLLNITPDHLDWHRDFDDYVTTKTNLFRNQKGADFAVVNLDDPAVQRIIPQIDSRIFPFSKKNPLKEGVFASDGKIFFSRKKIFLLNVSELTLRGDHNIDNVLAACAVSILAGIPLESLKKSIIEFKGLPHRLEFVTKIRGIDYYNDSKATNPDAAIKAMRALGDPLILLAGGRNKGNDLKLLANEIKEKTKAVILFGEAASDLKAYLRDSHLKIYEVLSLPEGVKTADKIAKHGDVVLLSPGCASFDMFSDYEERGKVFKEAVFSLK